MTLRTFVLVLCLSVGAFASMNSDDTDRSADAAAIRAHIESIFQAFIDGDEQKIFATHSEDWRGFLEGYHKSIKGIDEYMRANGIDWPKPANAPKPGPYFPAGTTYKMSDFDVQFYGSELAVATFVGEFVREGVTLRRLRIMDVYAKRKGGWIQVASHTVVDPNWRTEQMSKPVAIGPGMRDRILLAREKVWRAWFANDRATLERLIPEEVIAMGDSGEGWSNRAAVFESAQRFAESGGKLVRLEFPKTEIQVYGNTVLVYTTYVYETEIKGQRTTSSGRATEMFVRRGDELVNVGWHMDAGK
jgi:ketosteroid isomerase-like protein